MERKGIFRFLICIVFTVGLYLLPRPESLDASAWLTMAVFLGTILSFLLKPLPIGAMVMIALVFLASTKALTFKEALYGFGDTTVWLVVAAFLIAGAVTNTGLGQRIALMLIRKLGRTTLGLGYSITAAELILGPVVPSNTARGGGLMAPMVNSLARGLKSFPGDQPDRSGSYLMLVGSHANLITAAMFMTGMAANPLVSVAARDVFGIDFEWLDWALGAIVPGLVSLLILPLVIFRLNKPEQTRSEGSQEMAREELKAMGPWSRNEKLLAGILILLLAMWITTPLHGLSSGLVALIGICIMLVLQVQKWSQMIENESALDVLVWLGGLVAMATALGDKGVTTWFAEAAQSQVAGMDVFAVLIILGLVYFYSMYGFSMLTGHIAAMVPAFFAVCLASGTPALVTIPLFAYFSNLCGSLTNYSSGPVIIYFGMGYVSVPRWFKVGFVMSLIHVVVWLGLGFLWWKILGWW
jgi:DASS family divalent anion:Na+ symporter